jgi:hypothetical protein
MNFRQSLTRLLNNIRKGGEVKRVFVWNHDR